MHGQSKEAEQSVDNGISGRTTLRNEWTVVCHQVSSRQEIQGRDVSERLNILFDITIQPNNIFVDRRDIAATCYRTKHIYVCLCSFSFFTLPKRFLGVFFRTSIYFPANTLKQRPGFGGEWGWGRRESHCLYG